MILNFKSLLQKVLKSTVEKTHVLDEIARSQAVGLAEQELFELEHIFAILVFGAFIGLPSPPGQIALDLLADSEKEIMILMQKVETGNEPLSVLASLFQVD
jgi:hypothetical protein